MRTFWKTLWIAVQRSPQDRRSRQFLRQLVRIIFGLLAIALFCGWLFHFAFLELGVQAIPFYIVLFAPAILGLYFFRRSSKKEDELVKFSLAADPNAKANSSEVQREARTATYLLERVAILSCLACRGVSEVQSRQNPTTAPNPQVRETTNGLLRKHGLWDKLEPNEGALCTQSAGSWPVQLDPEIIAWCEQVRIIRWVLGFDPELVPLPHQESPDVKLAWNLLQQLSSLPNPRLLAPWSIRKERDIASQYFCRIYLELRDRNLLRPGSPDLAITSPVSSWDSSNDLLVGKRTIQELDNEELSRFAQIVVARQAYLAYVLELQEAPHPFSHSSWHPAAPNS